MGMDNELRVFTTSNDGDSWAQSVMYVIASGVF